MNQNAAKRKTKNEKKYPQQKPETRINFYVDYTD